MKQSNQIKNVCLLLLLLTAWMPSAHADSDAYIAIAKKNVLGAYYRNLQYPREHGLDSVMTADAVAGIKRIETNGESSWTRIATGTFYYVMFSSDEDGNPEPKAGYSLYKRDDKDNIYKITEWLMGTDFTFTWDKTSNKCVVLEQAIGYEHPSYGTMYIIEGKNYSSSYSDHTSYYDPETKTFYFYPAYIVDDGSLGQYEEKFEISGFNIDISATAFPDENFRNYLLSQPYGEDGVLTSEEISGITVLDVSNLGIRSLKGIEFLEHLETLYCYNNQLTASEIDKLISYLPEVESGVLQVLYSDDDANEISFSLLEKAKQKGWKFYKFDGSSWIEIILEYHDGDVFVAQTDEGVDMTFVIINAGEKTVKVGDGQVSAINQQTEGEITVPSSVFGFHVTAISERAFINCTNITRVNIGNSVKSLGLEAFYRCSNLQRVTIGGSVEHIGASAFNGCMNLSSVRIPNSVQAIGEAAFYYCTNMVQVIIGDGVKSIGDYAFQGCRTLCYLDLGNSVEEIGRQAFADCPYIGYDWYETGWDMTLKFPNSLKVIGPFAFSYCRFLSVLNLPQSLESVDGTSFDSCPLETITVAEGNPMYDSRDNCNAVIHTANNELVIGCKNSTIPTTVTRIGQAAFQSCKDITSIILPNGLTSIGDAAFRWCSGLTEINIPNSVTYIGTEAFLGCSSLTRLSIPASVMTIGETAFSGCPFESITVNEENTVFDSRDNCNAIVKTAEDELIVGCPMTVIPNTIKRIGAYSFYSCDGLTSIDVPNSVTTIGKAAFKYSDALTSVTLPKSLTSIEEEAFYGCSALAEIKSFIIEPFAVNVEVFIEQRWNEESNSYDYVFSSATLYVPAGTKSLYEATEGWNRFQNIVEMEGEEPSTDIAIDATNFPDENFRNWILAQDYGQDALLTEEEIAGITGINVSEKEIANLTGIELFTNLTFLNCSSNRLTSLDLTNNDALKRVYCSVNQIKDSAMDELISSLPTVDSGRLNAMNPLESGEGNKITPAQVAAANAKGWKVFQYQYGHGWVEMSDEEPPAGIAIDATNFPDDNFRAWLLRQDYGQDGVLTEEEIQAVTEIDVHQKGISVLKGIEFFTALTTLQCSSNQLTSLDVSLNTALVGLYCNVNQLTSLDVSNNTALQNLSCSENQLTSLDVTKNVKLEFLNCEANKLTSLDVSKNTALVILYCDNNQLTSLDVTTNTALTTLTCIDNQLMSLDVSKNVALEYLNCEANKLTSLDVSYNTALVRLYCGHNQLTSLDVTKNVALTLLFCYNNQLKSLDVTNNVALTVLSIICNQISGTEMDKLVSSLPSIDYGTLFAIDYTQEEGNVVTPKQVSAANARGWKVTRWDAETERYVEMSGEDPDGIQSTDKGQLTVDDAVIYNLSGQRLSKPQRGVNIINGKKMVVK